MYSSKKPIELLAPAKDKKCAFAAINCGADAIYIGAIDFGARKNACNSLEDLKEVINYAHKFNVKVFVTLNTILFDNELKNAKKLIEKLYELNTDAIIIQDMGILELDIPPINLHASTQCNNSNIQKIKFLEEIGFQRAILARELSIEQIKNISAQTNIELEAFIHGALCVSYSGQCYLSYAIGGRSANRGECAQPCRKPYSLIDGEGKKIIDKTHLLCLKDLNVSDYLEEMILAGVTSFKIEGRLKDENYIKNTVSFYREKIDNILIKHNLKRSSQGVSIKDFVPNLNKTFNRGFCSYFLKGRNTNITSFLSPKNIGELVGTVKNIYKNTSFTLCNGELNQNDGITFFDKDNNLCGTKIEKSINGIYTPTSLKNIAQGTKIYKNIDYKFIKKLEKSLPTRKIPITIDVKINEEHIQIKIKDFYDNDLNINIPNQFEKAENQIKAAENIKKQLSKTGDTEFIVTDINFETTTIPFIQINKINEIRRKIIQDFQEIRQKNYKIKKQPQINYPQIYNKMLDYKYNITNELAKKFYEKCGAKIIEYGLEHPTQKNFKDKTVMTTKHCIRYSLNLCSKNGKKIKEPLYLIDETGKKYKLKFDCKNCIMEIKF